MVNGAQKIFGCKLRSEFKRMGLDYVDIFYSHRPDPDTPLEETMMALDSIVKQEKLYMLVFPIMMQNKQKKPLRS